MKYIYITKIITLILCTQGFSQEIQRETIDSLESKKELEFKKVTQNEFNELLMQSIKDKNAEKLFALLIRNQLNSQNVTADNLKLFYDNFKKELWQEPNGQILWRFYVQLADKMEDLYFVNQVEKDILLFDYVANVNDDIPFVNVSQYSRYSKLKIIIPWFLKHKSQVDFDKLYSKVKNAKRKEILRAMVCYFVEPKDNEKKIIIAKKMLQAYSDLKTLGETETLLEQFLDYSDNSPRQGVADAEEEKIFKLKDYYGFLISNKNKLNPKELDLLNRLSPLFDQR